MDIRERNGFVARKDNRGRNLRTGESQRKDGLYGTVYFTDIQAQEGDRLTGYTINTETMLQKFREGGVIVPARFYNGVVRSGETVILFNLGSTSAGLDCHISVSYTHLDVYKRQLSKMVLLH